MKIPPEKPFFDDIVGAIPFVAVAWVVTALSVKVIQEAVSR